MFLLFCPIMTGQRRKGKRPIPFKVYTHSYLFKLNNLKQYSDVNEFTLLLFKDNWRQWNF